MCECAVVTRPSLRGIDHIKSELVYGAAEQDGEILIPRVVINHALSESLYPTSSIGPVMNKSVASIDYPFKMTSKTTQDSECRDMVFVEDRSRTAHLQSNWVCIDVRACPIAFADIERLQNANENVGFVYSGVVSSLGQDVSKLKLNDRVCALSNGGFSSVVYCPVKLVSKIPDTMDFATAATIWSHFCTAYYALFHVGQVCAEQTVLVEDASSGLGQAALTLLHNAGIKVLSSSNTMEGTRMLEDMRELCQGCILPSDSSRRTVGATHCNTLDLVLHTSRSDTLNEDSSWLASSGRLVYIQRGRSAFQLPTLCKNQMIAAVDFNAAVADQPEAIMRAWNTISDICNQGVITGHTSFRKLSLSQADVALSIPDSSELTDEVVFEVLNEDIVKVSKWMVLENVFECRNHSRSMLLFH